MLAVLRRVGIAIGSVVIAYLAVSLVGGVLLGQWVQTNPDLIGVISFVLGGLIYVDILRRESRRSDADSRPVPNR